MADKPRVWSTDSEHYPIGIRLGGATHHVEREVALEIARGLNDVLGEPPPKAAAPLRTAVRRIADTLRAWRTHVAAGSSTKQPQAWWAHTKAVEDAEAALASEAEGSTTTSSAT